MSKQPQERLSLEQVEAALVSGQLRPKARALLLLKLCQIASVFGSEKANAYYAQLRPVLGLVPEDVKETLEEMRRHFESPSPPSGGFAGECVNAITAAMSDSGATASAKRTALEACEERLNKRWWPAGKGAVRLALFKAWLDIDRARALTMARHIELNTFRYFLRAANKKTPLTPSEWDAFKDATWVTMAGNSATTVNQAELALEILSGPRPQLNVPNRLIGAMMSGLMAGLSRSSDPGDKLGETLDSTERLVGIVLRPDRVQEVRSSVFEAIIQLLGNTESSLNWAQRFSVLRRTITIAANSKMLTVKDLDALAPKLPSHMMVFGTTHGLAMLATRETAPEYLELAVSKARDQKVNAGTWFLVVLTNRGMGDLAMKLARESSQLPSEVLSQVRRAWLCNDAAAASQGIPLEDLRDDPIGQFLARPPGAARAEYLREVTAKGSMDLPASLWVKAAPPEEKKGFWASLLAAGKTTEQMQDEYLARNPLYPTLFNVTVNKTEQFTEFVSLSGYAKYDHETVDAALLEALVRWGDTYPDEVKALANRMWQAIKPEDQLLMLSCLRNALFTRCNTVLAACPEVLTEGFLAWLKAKLVDSSLSWQVGNTTFRVQYDAAALSRMCVRSALAIQSYSVTRRDELLKIGLTRYPSDSSLADLAARTYNGDKPPFDLSLPWGSWATKDGSVDDGWQIGIIKNAISPLIDEFAAISSAPAVEAAASQQGQGVPEPVAP